MRKVGHYGGRVNWQVRNWPSLFTNAHPHSVMPALTRIQRCCSHSGGGSLALRVLAQQWASVNSMNGARPLRPTRRNHNTASTASTNPTSPTPAAVPKTPPVPSKRHPVIKQAAAVVVGGGPAGIAAVGKLLETIPSGKIVWIDRSFEGGSLHLYREVPRCVDGMSMRIPEPVSRTARSYGVSATPRSTTSSSTPARWRRSAASVMPRPGPTRSRPWRRSPRGSPA